MTSTTAVPNRKPLKVGFDLDGVILYNPIRIFRPLVTGFKRLILHKSKTKFFIPQTPFQRQVFRLLHKTSFIVAPGLSDIRDLVKAGTIEAYLITGRFNFLKSDLDRWLKKIKADEYFTGIYHNAQNQQPHLFKEERLKTLGLDIFIEDNWDIVKHLATEKIHGRLPTDTYWIYNLFDRRINYPHKYPMLKQAVNSIKKQLSARP